MKREVINKLIDKLNHQHKFLLIKLNNKLITMLWRKGWLKLTVFMKENVIICILKKWIESSQALSWLQAKPLLLYPVLMSVHNYLQKNLKTIMIKLKSNQILLLKESIPTENNILYLVWEIHPIKIKFKIQIWLNFLCTKISYGKLISLMVFMLDFQMIFKNLINFL